MDDTISKAEAEYQDAPKGREFCSRCTMFRQPHRCTLVRGYIEPRGWCKHWTGKSEGT